MCKVTRETNPKCLLLRIVDSSLGSQSKLRLVVVDPTHLSHVPALRTMHLHFAFTQFVQALPYGAEPRLASAGSMLIVVRKAVGMFVLQVRCA